MIFSRLLVFYSFRRNFHFKKPLNNYLTYSYSKTRYISQIQSQRSYDVISNPENRFLAKQSDKIIKNKGITGYGKI